MKAAICSDMSVIIYESTWQCTIRLESSGSTSLCCSKCRRFRVVEFVVTAMFTILLLLLLWLFLLRLLFFFFLFLSFLLLLLLFFFFLFFFYSLYFPCCQQLHHHHQNHHHQFSTLNLRLLRDKYAVNDHLFS